ncbi:50S ribosomal protein L13 [Thermogladius sp. 4427co]|uniref:50S ribosomal protein L13 n=1 Tax=Thermogladius sp. 4427co TaxID=3450718 RepID=UPI003F7B14F4
MAESSEQKTIIVDASGLILGRMASIVAKKLLEGYRVYIVNAEKAVLSGEKKRVIEGYKLLLKVRTHYNPEKSGIRRPRSPANIVKRAIRGMLPMDKAKGRMAYKRLRVYIGMPKEFEGKPLTRFPEAEASRLSGRYITVGEVAESLGWRGVTQ